MGMENTAAFWSSIVGFPYTFKFVGAALGHKTKSFHRADGSRSPLVAGRSAEAARRGFPPVLTAIMAVLGATRTSAPTASTSTRCRLGPGQVPGFQSMCWNGGALLAKGPSSSAAAPRQPELADGLTIVMLALGASVFWSASITAGCSRGPSGRVQSFADAMKTFGHRPCPSSRRRTCSA
jgi:hypothetical protein